MRNDPPAGSAQTWTRRAREQALREELRALLPGYTWIIPRAPAGVSYLEAVGRISSGANRLSTLTITRGVYPVDPWYEARCTGYNRSGSASGATLKRALRALQRHFESAAKDYRRLAAEIADARQAPAAPPPAEHAS